MRKIKLFTRITLTFFFFFSFHVFAQANVPKANVNSNVATSLFPINIDFGASANSASPWNNLTGFSLNSTKSNLLDTSGNNTGISITVNDAFSATNTLGATTTNIQNWTIPSTASSDCFYSSMLAANGNAANPTSGFLISGLDPNLKYAFSFFSSRANVTPAKNNKETKFTVTGLLSNVAYCNATNNTSNIAKVDSVSPATDGTVTIVVTAGPNNSTLTTEGYYYLNAMQIKPINNPVPTISSFTPTSAGNGTSVIITGTDFTGATAVSFGDTAASSYTVDSNTQITAIVAAGTSGSVNVTTPGGTATKSGFTYLVPATPVSTTGGTLSSLGLSVEQLANTELTISSGEMIVDQSATLNKVIVAPGAKLTLGSNTLTTTNGITLQSDASGTATLTDSYSSPAANATVEQYVQAGRNWYMSSPITTAPYSSLNRGTSVVEWNEVNKTWDNVIAGNLVVGKGYIQVATSNPSVTGSTGTVNFTGTTNSGDISVTLSRTETGSSRGFNLVGNPYPSYLDWKKVATANPNVLPTIWLRSKTTGGNYTFATVNVASYLNDHVNTPIITSSASSTVTTYIPPMQAYWVRLNTSPSTTAFTVTNDMRSHGDDVGNTFKVPSKKTSTQALLRLQVSNGTTNDEAVVYFNENASNGYDIFDSPKMSDESTSVPEIYTIADGEELVINGLSNIQYDTEIPIGFATGESNTFSIKASEIYNFDTGTRIILKDYNDINSPVIADLTNGDSYSFSSDATARNTNRFTLIFKSPTNTTVVKSENKNEVWFSTSNGQIVVNGNLFDAALLEIFNAIGEKIISRNLTESTVLRNDNLPNGTYIVRFTNDQKTITRKIIVDR